MYLSLSLSLSLYLSFFGQVMSPHYSDQMSQRSYVSRISLLWSSLNVFVFFIVFVFVYVFVFVIVFVFVFVFVCVFFYVNVFFGQVMSSHHSDEMSQRSQVSRVTL